MFDSQSTTVILPQFPELQLPLLLQPFGMPFIVEEHDVQLI